MDIDTGQDRPAHCPALLITSTASGQGKTTLTAALARLHARQGRQVRIFKCGPDFLDPHWHALASGAPVHSIDLWMTGEDDIRARLHAAAREADLIIVEGVMGLFDGDPCAADVAERLGLPVLAVIDASGMAETFGALAHGLRHYRPGLRWAGLLANRVGSERHAELLRRGLRDPALWLGALARVQGPDAAALLPERHLGLVAAHELGDALQRLDVAADALLATPLGRLPWQAALGQGASWQDWCVAFELAAPSQQVQPWLAGRTVAVARDAAFSFIYEANLDCLRALGARLAFFSPLAGERLPGCDALWLPGGYPELHLAALAAQVGLREDIASHAAAGKAIWAECGGMLALCERLTDNTGRTTDLWGLLPGHARMQPRLAGLGMLELPTPWGPLRGHTFHYSRLETDMPEAARSHRPGQAVQPGRGEALYRHGSVHASYFHAWFASQPRAVAALLGAAPRAERP